MESHEHKKGSKPLTPLQEARLDRFAERIRNLPTERKDLLIRDLSEQTFSVKEVSDLLECHPETVRRAIRKGKLKASKSGRNYRISKLDLNNYCVEHGDGKLIDDTIQAQEDGQACINVSLDDHGSESSSKNPNRSGPEGRR